MAHYAWLGALGLAVGAFGTLIGAGGGFVLVPVLLLLYPGEGPEIITSISLAVVFCNAVSGSWAYARMARIDYQSGLLFAAAAIPGAILGALSTASVPRRAFDVGFAILILAVSIYLFFFSRRIAEPRSNECRYPFVRNIVEKDGTTHTFFYNPMIGVGLSSVVGYVSSFLGIGGGIIHVPVLSCLLNFPVHIATATSHFVLAIMALAGTIVHVVTGSFFQGIHRIAPLAVGVIIGAQAGASLSKRIQGCWIIRCLAIALLLFGLRILIMALASP